MLDSIDIGGSLWLQQMVKYVSDNPEISSTVVMAIATVAMVLVVGMQCYFNARQTTILEQSKRLPIEVAFYSSCLETCKEGLGKFEEPIYNVQKKLHELINATDNEESDMARVRAKYLHEKLLQQNDICTSFIDTWEWLLPKYIGDEYRRMVILLNDICRVLENFGSKSMKEKQKPDGNTHKGLVDCYREYIPEFQEFLSQMKQQSTALYNVHHSYFVTKNGIDKDAKL